MMEIEKKLALSDLSTYHEDYHLRQFAKNVVKYQNFKAKAALRHIGEVKCYKETVAYNAFRAGVKYIKYEVKNKFFVNKFYKFIQEELDKHTQPLIPPENEVLVEYNLKTNKRPLVGPTREVNKEDEQSIQRIENSSLKSNKDVVYGLMYKGKIKILEEEDIRTILNINEELGITKDLKRVELEITIR